MENQNFQKVKADVSNQQSKDAPKSFYVSTTGYGFNAATTDIIRITPKKQVA